MTFYRRFFNAIKEATFLAAINAVIIYRVALHFANYYIFTVRQIRLEW